MERLFLLHGEAEKLKEKFPDRVPIIVTKAPNASDIPDLTKHKFLAPSGLTMGQFIYVVRRNIQLPPEKAMFFFIGNMLPMTGSLLSELYHTYKSPDGALRMCYTSENTFGFGF